MTLWMMIKLDRLFRHPCLQRRGRGDKTKNSAQPKAEAEFERLILSLKLSASIQMNLVKSERLKLSFFHCKSFLSSRFK